LTFTHLGEVGVLVSANSLLTEVVYHKVYSLKP